jgi:two-component system OmpR family sensor kinase
MRSDLAALNRLALFFATAGGAVLVLGLAIGWWLTSRALLPIKEISRTAAGIAEGDLSQRINTAETETELGELAGVLNETFARLEASFAQQTRFTSDAAHELRTPLTVLITQTQSALARERTSAEYVETLRSCHRAGQRLRRLTESLLDLARLDSGTEPFFCVDFDLSHTASECLELIQPLAEQRHLTLKTDLPETMCHGDPGRLGQVITNLLANAIHYNREGGEVLLSLRQEGDAVLLVVADTGIGITPEDLPHVFERFYRADKSRSAAPERTGLGLAISQAILKAHGGSIEVFSEVDKGTAFTIRIPAKAAQSTAADSPSMMKSSQAYQPAYSS